MGALRRTVLSALPKFLISRTTGLLCRVPIPRFLRRPLYRLVFERCYGARLQEMAGAIEEYPCFAAFFRRPLKEGARPIATAEVVWPCDGKIITAGPIAGGMVPQVKGRDYQLRQLLQDEELAAALAEGSQATVYLAPGDYHRVHSPIAGQIREHRHIPGALFPVNQGAVDSIPDLFPRNERVVFRYELDDGRPAAVLMVSALNVGDTLVTRGPGAVACGDELGQFGFGSTAIVVLPPGAPCFAQLPRESQVWMGAAAALNQEPREPEHA